MILELIVVVLACILGGVISAAGRRLWRHKEFRGYGAVLFVEGLLPVVIGIWWVMSL